jgi:hypothetical protein
VKPFFIFVLLILSGCSSIYHEKKGWVPEGYADKKLSDTEYLISFQTYRGEDWEYIQSLLLYRASEVGKLNSYSFFSMRDTKKQEHVDLQSFRDVVTTYAEGSTNTGDLGGAGIGITGVATPQYTQEYTIRTLSSLVTYSNERKGKTYSVEQLLSDSIVK